jgi:hypothetical protein
VRADRWVEEQDYRQLQRRADRICSLIVASDYPRIDITIAIGQLREFAQEHFPHRMALFERVYESRFRRLWTQFRNEPVEGLVGS